MTWISRTGPPKPITSNANLWVLSWQLYPERIYFHYPQSCTWSSHLAHLTGVDLGIFQKWSFYIPRRGTKHSTNGVTQILPGTCNEDIKLDRRFIGYLIFNWEGKKKKTQKPTNLHIWPSDEFFCFTWQLFPLFKNLHKYCQDRTCMVKNMQNPELSPAASPTVQCQDRAVGLIQGAALLLHVTRSGTCPAGTQPSGEPFMTDPTQKASFGLTLPFSWWWRGICLFSCGNWAWDASMWPPLPRGESRQAKHGRESQGCWKEREVVFTHTRTPCVISRRINSARTHSRADTYLWFREIYLC